MEFKRQASSIMGAGKTRVLVVDDHPVMREGLALVLERESDLAVCGEAGDIRQALKEIESSKPDLVLVDISLARENGLDLIREIRARDPQLPVLVYSMHDESVYAERALRAGAHGYIMKQEPTKQLVQAIRQIMQGEIYLKRTAVKQIVLRLASDGSSGGTSPLHLLSEREFDVLILLGRGLATQAIADAKQISAKTVYIYRANIKRKLALKNSAGLVQFAVQWTDPQA